MVTKVIFSIAGLNCNSVQATNICLMCYDNYYLSLIIIIMTTPSIIIQPCCLERGKWFTCALFFCSYQEWK